MSVLQKSLVTLLVISTIAGSYQLSAMEPGPGGVPSKEVDRVRFLLEASGDQAHALLAMVNDTTPTALEILLDSKPSMLLASTVVLKKMSQWLPRGARQIFQIRDVWAACHEGVVEDAQSILGQACDQYIIISTQDILGRTALHFAAQNGNLEIVKLLIDVAVKADMLQDFITSRTTRAEDCQETALDLARKCGHTAVVEFLEAVIKFYSLKDQ